MDPSVVPKLNVDQGWTVEKALAEMGLNRPQESGSAAAYTQFYRLLERLKLTKREGWKRYGINQGESISDHMYRMAMMAMFPPPPLISLAGRLDPTKCMKMCLVHDIAESLVGDITPADGVSKQEKRKREDSAMKYLRALLPAPQGEELHAIFDEFEASITAESKFVQDLDKLELLQQMVEYEGRGHKDLTEFTYVVTKMLLPESKLWAERILEERQNHHEHSAGSIPGMKDLQDEYYS